MKLAYEAGDASAMAKASRALEAEYTRAYEAGDASAMAKASRALASRYGMAP